MNRSAQPTLERVFRVDLPALGTRRHLVSNHAAVHADVPHERTSGCVEDALGELEVLLLEDLGVKQVAAAALFAEAVHVVPTESAGDMLEVAVGTLHAEAHVEVGTALVDVSAGAVVALNNLRSTFSQMPRMKYMQTLVSWLKLHFSPYWHLPWLSKLLHGLILLLLCGFGQSQLGLDVLLFWHLP